MIDMIYVLPFLKVLLVAGGFMQSRGRGHAISSTELLEVDKSTSWTVTNPLPLAIYYTAAITLDNTVFITGIVLIV